MKKRGVTIIETLIVLLIIVVLVSIVGTSFSYIRDKQILNSETTKILSVLQDARTRTLSSVGDKQYGVHFETNQIILYSGSVYDPLGATNEKTNLSNVIVQDIVFSNGGNNILFKRLTGEAQVFGTTTIALKNDASSTQTIIIRETGISEVE